MCMANLSPGTGSAKPLATALAGVPFSSTSCSPRSSAMAPMSLNDSRMEGMPPWWSLIRFTSRMPLNSPIRVPPWAGLPAVDQGRGRRVRVVLDGDRLPFREVLELGRQHRLLDGGLERVAVRGLDRDVELDLLPAAHVGLTGRADGVHNARRLDSGLPELVGQLRVGGLLGHVATHRAAHPLLHSLVAGRGLLGLGLRILDVLEEPQRAPPLTSGPVT